MRYEIDVTYRCNLSCKDCNRLVGVLPIPDCEVTLDQLAEAGRRVRRFLAQQHLGGRLGVVKLSGGEPLLRPDLRQLCDVVIQEWNPSHALKVCTNGTLAVPDWKDVYFRRSLVHRKVHYPFAVSPFDLGIPQTELGWKTPCRPQNFCGQGFDAFGFQACPFAGIIGRVLGIDPYCRHPVLMNIQEICAHCVYSISPRIRDRVEKAITRGEVDYPSETYREGIARCREDAPHLRRFEER